ncbi:MULTISPECIES: YihY/virulence factor BrkB family protein [Gordonia]|uniref:YihY/virulence factor BrkB family protein n=1 Tax=Gordonia TaxID=2053 RepID=UPI001FE94470|nr:MULTISPECIES: YihY/virulence factor BrkB family protein [Gordonia]
MPLRTDRAGAEKYPGSGRADADGHRDPAPEAEPVPQRLPVLRNMHKMVWRTIVNSWNHGIIGWAAQAAFWQALSLPPLLLGLLGSLGYVSGWFGADTTTVISDRIISLAGRAFSENVMNDLISPTVENVLSHGKVSVVSVGFVMSLWAGSSAVSCYVASIVRAHDQHEVRNPVWQRIFALLLYVAFLAVSVVVLPLVALGPTYLRRIVPDEWDSWVTRLIDYGYFPAVAILLIGVLTTLYHLALPNPPPWHRLLAGSVVAAVFFWLSSSVLREYLATITKVGVSYGALATPIAFLLFAFFLGFAIVGGAEVNAAIQSMWPAKPTASTQVKEWVHSQTSDFTDQIKTLPERFGSGPIRRR